tara:strand:+ start:1879 stop:2883 length:1005 start_codon:yes stop_codon:yes gene_type:complete
MAINKITNGNIDGRRHQAVSMDRRRCTPLFNTCPYRQGFSLVIISLVLLISLPIENIVAEESSHQEKVTLLDVHVLDSSCLNEESCFSWQPSNLIEYFGADWCEPCLEIEQEINQIDFNESVIIHHHPSTSDSTFLQYSKLKFDNQYRLLFIPSIVINGNGLLTGTSQGLEINQAINDINSSFNGIQDIELNNGTLYWNASAGYNLNLWMLEETPHEFENYSHQNLATSFLSFDSGNKSANLSSWTENWNGRIVFMLEDAGITNLTSASSQPLGNFDFNQEQDVDDEKSVREELKPSTLALMVGIILFLLLLPALIMFQGLRKQGKKIPDIEQE